MDERYTAMSQPPQDALKKINIGALKGKSDINPQWRIEALTEQFGLCGIGWKFEIVNTSTQPCGDGQILLFMQVNLFFKDGKQWSAPIPGFGGDMLIEKNKNGLVPNDEAFKMCLTDALGNAAKCIGVAANVYRGFNDGSKYNKKQDEPVNQQQVANKPQAPAQQAPAQQIEWVKNIQGATCILANNGKYYPLEPMNAKQLGVVLAEANYAKCHDEARRLLAEKGAA